MPKEGEKIGNSWDRRRVQLLYLILTSLVTSQWLHRLQNFINLVPTRLFNKKWNHSSTRAETARGLVGIAWQVAMKSCFMFKCHDIESKSLQHCFPSHRGATTEPTAKYNLLKKSNQPWAENNWAPGFLSPVDFKLIDQIHQGRCGGKVPMPHSGEEVGSIPPASLNKCRERAAGGQLSDEISIV